jgi:hypothetical protein
MMSSIKYYLVSCSCKIEFCIKVEVKVLFKVEFHPLDGATDQKYIINRHGRSHDLKLGAIMAIGQGRGRRPRSGRGALRRVGVWGGSPYPAFGVRGYHPEKIFQIHYPNPRILAHIFGRTVVYRSVLF